MNRNPGKDQLAQDETDVGDSGAMGVKRALKSALSLLGLLEVSIDVLRCTKSIAHRLWPSKSLPERYISHGRVPWSDGYREYKSHFIAQTVAAQDMIARFGQRLPLPAGYGFSLDERCVEFPWVFAQIQSGPEVLLDAGAALNHAFILDHPIWGSKSLHVLTLAPEGNCFWQRGISYIFEDLRDLPIRDGYYDTVISISTLEHVGMDNRAFTGLERDNQQRPSDFILAARELRRVLKPGGRLLFTVPFGRYRNLRTQQVFDERLLEETIAAFAPAQAGYTFFRYTQQGWQFAEVSECRDCEYVPWIALPLLERQRTPFPLQPDGAAAARAVACIRLEKPL
jgi:SAM-dependent methyltransferase